MDQVLRVRNTLLKVQQIVKLLHRLLQNLSRNEKKVFDK